LKRKKVFQNRVVLFLSILIIIFLISEISLQVVGHTNDIDFRLYDQELTNPDRLPDELFVEADLRVSQLAPNTDVLATTSDFSVIYRINSQGLRDYEYPQQTDKTRIAVYGDSLTFGEGVPRGERFADIAEDEIENAEILNHGVPGYSLGDMYLHYRFSDYYEDIDHVVFFVSESVLHRDSSHLIENDTITIDQNDSANSLGHIDREDEFFTEETGLLRKHSHLVSYISYRWNILKLQSEMEEYDKNLWQRANDHVSENYGEARPASEKQPNIILNETVSKAEDNEHNFIVINIGTSKIPAMEEIRGITYYDLSENMSSYGEENRIRFQYDPHYNPETHNFIGKNVAQIIQENYMK